MVLRDRLVWSLLAVALGCSACQLPAATPDNGAIGRSEPELPQAVPLTEENTWAFDPEEDAFSPEALLDLRSLNEAVAGETGFIRRSADGRDFVRGDGTPIRFWAVNSYYDRDGEDDLAAHARFLAKRGVNMVRWHGTVFPREAGAELHETDAVNRDRLWRSVAVMKQAGIYLTMSPYYALPFKPQPGWESPRDSEGFYGLLFFDPALQAAYKTWLREVLTVENPYTGIALKDDPALAIVQLQNEDSLLFWTVKQIQGRDRAILKQKYKDWLLLEHGSVGAVIQHWDGTFLPGDDPDRGEFEFYDLWELTQAPSTAPRGKARRLADQLEFLTGTMRRFNAEMARYLREELGVKQLINAGNWKTASPLYLNDAERYSYAATDVIAANRYYNGGGHEGRKRGFAIVDGDRFPNRSVLFFPDRFPLNFKQVTGRPFLVTEMSWVPPLEYQSEGPFLTSIYQSLTGIDGAYWFAVYDREWKQPASFLSHRLEKWVVNSPELLGNFPAAALLYRNGYVAAGQPVVREQRPLGDLWKRRLPAISETASFDPNRDRSDRALDAAERTSIDPRAFLVGPVEVTYDADTDEVLVLDLEPFVSDREGTIRSVTEEILWDYQQGFATLNAPKAKGATGFLGDRGPIDLDGVTLEFGNRYATAMLVALDDRPLAVSRRILLQVGTVARPTGWVQEPETWLTEGDRQVTGYAVRAIGRAPWRVLNTDLSVTLRNPSLHQAIALDANGMAMDTIPLERRGEQVRLVLPPMGKYFILE